MSRTRSAVVTTLVRYRDRLLPNPVPAPAAGRREDPGVTDVARIRDQALQIAHGWSGPDVPATWALTASLFATLAADDGLLDLARGIPEDRLPPLLFVAATQYLATTDRDDAFAAYFPEPGGRQPALDGQFASRYREFCLARRVELADLCDRHRYQMNEVARTTQVALAMADVAQRHPGRDVALVDLGTGAGLGLLPDRYGYSFGELRFGDLASTVRLRCDRIGAAAPSAVAVPPVVWRMGIDVDPVDLDDAEARAWLMACLPPEADALTRIVPAIDAVREVRPEVEAGDVLDMVPDVFAELPDGPLACVTDAYAAVFLDVDGRDRLCRDIARVGRTRDIVWISLDPLVPLGAAARHTVHGDAAPAALVARNRDGGVFAALSVFEAVGGSVTRRLLATAHPSGTRMEWLDPAVVSA